MALNRNLNHVINISFFKKKFREINFDKSYNCQLIAYVCIFFYFTAKATYAAIAKTYAYLTPDLWKETVFTKSPYQEFTDYLAKNHRPVASQRQEVKQY